jgi:hypothetical protein
VGDQHLSIHWNDTESARAVRPGDYLRVIWAAVGGDYFSRKGPTRHLTPVRQRQAPRQRVRKRGAIDMPFSGLQKLLATEVGEQTWRF